MTSCYLASVGKDGEKDVCMCSMNTHFTAVFKALMIEIANVVSMNADG